MAEDKGKQKQQQNISDDYIIDHALNAEIHINYGGTVLKLQGTIKLQTESFLDLLYEDDNNTKHELFINKAHVIMIKSIKPMQS